MTLKYSSHIRKDLFHLLKKRGFTFGVLKVFLHVGFANPSHFNDQLLMAFSEVIKSSFCSLSWRVKSETEAKVINAENLRNE